MEIAFRYILCCTLIATLYRTANLKPLLLELSWVLRKQNRSNVQSESIDTFLYDRFPLALVHRWCLFNFTSHRFHIEAGRFFCVLYVVWERSIHMIPFWNPAKQHSEAGTILLFYISEHAFLHQTGIYAGRNLYSALLLQETMHFPVISIKQSFVLTVGTY